jgi:hypothetical protein
MNCKQVEDLLPLYAGRDLEEKRATLISEHVQGCVACARVAEEYRDSVQLSEQFAPPVFSEAVYAGIRQRVLREIETEAIAPSWSQRIVSVFRPRLTWAIASVLLVTVSTFAIYFFVNKGKDERQLANQPPVEVQPETKEHPESGSQPSALPRTVNTGNKKQQLAGIHRARPKRSRDLNITANNVSSPPATIPEPTLFPPPSSAALVKTTRVEIQTKDPKIRIIWFLQPETKPAIPGSKGI